VFFDEGLEFAMAKISFQSTLSNLVKTMAKELLPRFEGGYKTITFLMYAQSQN
jgi:hypothetical protein